MTPELAVILLDDHDLFRAGLRGLLQGAGLNVAADRRLDTPQLPELVREAGPVVVLADIHGESTDSLPLISQLCDLDGVSVMVLTRSLEPSDVYRAIRAGVRGYAFKETPVDDLAGAVRAIAAGGAWLAPTVTSMVLEFLSTGRVPRIDDTDMSDRELDVLRLMAVGYDNNQIAAELNISAKTVKNHISSIFTKLDMSNRVQAAVYAVRAGIA